MANIVTKTINDATARAMEQYFPFLDFFAKSTGLTNLDGCSEHGLE